MQNRLYAWLQRGLLLCGIVLSGHEAYGQPPQPGFLHWLDSTHTYLVGRRPQAQGMGVWRATDLKPVIPEILAALEHLQGPYLQAAVYQADGAHAWGVLHRNTLEWSLKPTYRQLILQDKYLLLQDTEGLWGLAQANTMELLLPVAYQELAIETVHGNPWVRVHKGEQLGYFHPGKGAWLLPPVYDAIEKPQANNPLPGHWLVRLGDRLGLFDPAKAQLVLRPEWQHIALADSQHLVLQQPEQTYRYALATGQRTEVPRLESRWPLLWAQPVGYLSYRGSMLQLGPYLVVGTHTRVAMGPGYLLHNVSTTDSTGLWLLEATTGRPLQHVVTLPGQDYPLSLNGVAAADQRLYATCDYNGVVAWALQDGALQLLWQAPQPGAAEGTPALADLNADGVADVVCMVRDHGVVALNGRSGQPLWVVLDTLQTLPQGSCMGSVALQDVNGDGVADVLVSAPGRRVPDGTTSEWAWTDAADAYLWALDGRTGSALWQVMLERGTGSKASPVVVQGPGTTPQVQLATETGGCYRLALNGAWLGSTRLPAPTVTTPLALGAGQYAYALSQPLPQGWGGGAVGVFQLAAGSTGIDRHGRPAQAATVLQQWGGQASATPLLADVLGLGYPQALWVQEGGLLQVATPDGRSTQTYGLPAGAEATPLVADVDANGRPELLLLGKDGVLRCYRTPGVGTARWGAFRGGAASQTGQYLLY
jgi:hypothetical protein